LAPKYDAQTVPTNAGPKQPSDGVSEARIAPARSSKSADRAAFRLRNKGLLSVRVMPQKAQAA